jgi:hypothetical protein
MAKSKSKQTLKLTLDASVVLQLALALFFITLGVVGIAQYNSRLSELGRAFSRLVGQPDNPVNLIMAIAELVTGIIVALALFVPLEKRMVWIAMLVIGILWVLKLLWVYVFNNAFEPDFAVWLNGLSADLVVLVGLWIVGRRYT